MNIRGVIETVSCGNMMTVLNGKTIGSIFMAGLVDHLSKEANMTPKQFFDLGDRIIKDLGFWRKGFSAIGEDGKVTISNTGPCYGECGNGERFRTQGVPKKMKEIEYAHAMMVRGAVKNKQTV